MAESSPPDVLHVQCRRCPLSNSLEDLIHCWISGAIMLFQQNGCLNHLTPEINPTFDVSGIFDRFALDICVIQTSVPHRWQLMEIAAEQNMESAEWERATLAFHKSLGDFRQLTTTEHRNFVQNEEVARCPYVVYDLGQGGWQTVVIVVDKPIFVPRFLSFEFAKRVDRTPAD